MAYQHFLQVNSIDPSQLRLRQQGHSPEDEELYNGDLAHFSKQENCKEVRTAHGQVCVYVLKPFCSKGFTLAP